nr:DUF4003 family protein [uncultured Butyrivibrio sp.]
MKTTLQTRCELLAENRNIINKGFVLENSLIKIASALVYTETDKTVDNAYLKECRGLLRKNKGAFSDFRSMNELMVSAKLAQQADPERYLEEITASYKMLHQGKVFGSKFMVLAAMNISDAGRFAEADSIIEKTKAIMKGMNKAHPVLTNEEDTCFAVLLAMTDKSVEDILTELEETYQTLKKDFSFHDNSVYSLAQVLTMKKGTVVEKCSKVVEIYNAFKDAGVKYGKDYEFASLGVLVGLNVRAEEIVNEVVDAADFLKTQKGFGMLDCSERQRLMFGAILYAGIMDEGVLSGASAFDSTIAMVIAEEIAFMMMMVAVSASAAANASH